MPGAIRNRLALIGPDKALSEFERSGWLGRLRGRHPELFERGATRAEWWFETARPVRGLGQLSAEWPDLLFLLDYDDQARRMRGLIKADRRSIDRCDLSY